MYSIGQVSKMFNLPISTLRYYDKEGLFPKISRKSGIRDFSDNEIETLRVIECLKKSGLEIKDIKLFMLWCTQGKRTYTLRKSMFEKQKVKVEEDIKKLNKTLDLLKFKCWYYDQAIQAGNEDKLKNIKCEDLPKEVQCLYKNSHDGPTIPSSKKEKQCDLKAAN